MRLTATNTVPEVIIGEAEINACKTKEKSHNFHDVT